MECRNFYATVQHTLRFIVVCPFYSFYLQWMSSDNSRCWLTGCNMLFVISVTLFPESSLLFLPNFFLGKTYMRTYEAALNWASLWPNLPRLSVLLRVFLNIFYLRKNFFRCQESNLAIFLYAMIQRMCFVTETMALSNIDYVLCHLLSLLLLIPSYCRMKYTHCAVTKLHKISWIERKVEMAFWVVCRLPGTTWDLSLFLKKSVSVCDRAKDRTQLKFLY